MYPAPGVEMKHTVLAHKFCVQVESVEHCKILTYFLHCIYARVVVVVVVVDQGPIWDFHPSRSLHNLQSHGSLALYPGSGEP